MGKIGQLGTLDEVLELCKVDERITPCIDFGHLNARTLGGIASKADYAAILDKVEAALGGARAKRFHVHFSRIEYSAGGEKRHWTFAETQFGPEPPAPDGAAGRTGLGACHHLREPPGPQAEDACTMQRLYGAGSSSYNLSVGLRPTAKASPNRGGGIAQAMTERFFYVFINFFDSNPIAKFMWD